MIHYVYYLIASNLLFGARQVVYRVLSQKLAAAGNKTVERSETDLKQRIQRPENQKNELKDTEIIVIHMEGKTHDKWPLSH